MKVAKASTENLKTWMSRLAKILPRRRKRSSRQTTVLANKNGSVFETAKTSCPILSETPFRQSRIQFLFWFQDKKKREDQLQKDRERKRKAYYAKKRTSCKDSSSVTRPAGHEFEIGSCIMMMNARFFVKRSAWVPLIGRISPRCRTSKKVATRCLKSSRWRIGWATHAVIGKIIDHRKSLLTTG